MLRVIAFGSFAILLAGCGADGEPITPTANLGIGVSSSGVSAGANVGVQSGPLSINLGLF